MAQSCDKCAHHDRCLIWPPGALGYLLSPRIGALRHARIPADTLFRRVAAARPREIPGNTKVRSAISSGIFSRITVRLSP